MNRTGNFFTICTVATICLAALLLRDGAGGASHGAREGADKWEAQGASAKAVAVTVDDLPGAVPGTGQSQGNLKDFQKINRAIPQILKAHHAPAIGFVNEWKLQVADERDARVTLLQAWLDAGLTLGNHTYSHFLQCDSA